MIWLASYILASMGLTILLVWPEAGIGAQIREKVRVWLPVRFHGTLDCYICASTALSALLCPIWWLMCGQNWCWLGWLIIPALFWLVLPFQSLNVVDETDTAQESQSFAKHRQEVCETCEEYNGNVCELRPSCRTTWRKFLAKPESKCPKGLF